MEAESIALKYLGAINEVWEIDLRDRFISAMKLDFEKIIVAKGFRTAGPFDNLDIMTYPEKKSSAFALTPEIRLFLTKEITYHNPATKILGGKKEGYYKCSGFVGLFLTEPLSREKMWIKKIDIPEETASFSYKYFLQADGSGEGQIYEGTTAKIALGSIMEKIYSNILGTAWSYFHPDEIVQLSKQAEEIRKKY